MRTSTSPRGLIFTFLFAAGVAISSASVPGVAGLRALGTPDHCEEDSIRPGCRPYILAQARGPSPRGVVSPATIIRRNVTFLIRVTLDAVTMSVRRVGVSARSMAATLRRDLQRRFVVSICCKDRIQANIIANDLARRFPGARIERKVKLRREGHRPDEVSRDTDPGLADVIDFVVFDRDGPKLVFEGCVEFESDEGGSDNPDSESYILDDNGAPTSINLTEAAKVQACLDFDTGEVTYELMATSSARRQVP